MVSFRPRLRFENAICWMSITALVLITMGAQIGSVDSVFWTKVSDSASYSPRDSSPNASVVHDDAVWVLAGWRNENDTIWHSKSDVWRSSDGVTWELINPTPPYDPYCAFVSFNGAIWAIGESSYQSEDGEEWEPVETNISFDYGSRAVVYNDEIWLTNGTSIYKSSNGYDWETVLQQAPWDYRVLPGFVVFQDKLWVFGGGVNYNTGRDHYFTDVWSSQDGVNWTLETPNAAWPGRLWFGYACYDDKIWITGGWDYYQRSNENGGNRNDTWYTENGVDWFSLPDSSWRPRHAPFVWVFNDALWMSSGYGDGGAANLYNDIWKLTSTWNEARIPQTFELPDTVEYGMPLPSVEYASSALPVQASYMGLQSNEPIVPGVYDIHVTNEGNSIFLPLDETRTVVVKKKDLFVTVPDYHKLFGFPNPEFEVDFDGFVYDDDASVIEEWPIASTTAEQFSSVGTYEISLEGGYSSRYNLVLNPGKLYIHGDGLQAVYFPNPVRSTLNVYVSTDTFLRVQLINAIGQTEMELSTEESSFQLDMSSLATGTYFLRLASQAGSRVLRIVKE